MTLPKSSSGMPTPKSVTITVTYRVRLSLVDILFSPCGDCWTLDPLRWKEKRGLLTVELRLLDGVARVMRSWLGGDRAALLTFIVTTLPDMLNLTALERKFTSTSCNRLCTSSEYNVIKEEDQMGKREKWVQAKSTTAFDFSYSTYRWRGYLRTHAKTEKLKWSHDWSLFSIASIKIIMHCRR